MALHCADERGILNVAGDDRESAVAEMTGVVPFPAGGEVVVDGHLRNRLVSEKPVDEMTPDEPGATDDEPTIHGAPTDSHFVDCVWRAGWLTRRCHITAQRPSV